MNILILTANIFTLLAFVAHAFFGDKDLKIIEPKETEPDVVNKREKWTMARCGWHMISIDLLFATIALAIINFSNFFNDEKMLLHILSIYFLAYSVVFLVTIVISKQFTKNYIKLGQWMLLLVISGLIYVGM